MTEHPLITDEAVKAVANALADLGDKGLLYATPDQAAQIALAAFIAHHEGERPCERCDDEDWLFDRAQHICRTTSLDWDRSRGLIYEKARASCPDCNGKARTDKLVKLSEILHFIRRQNRNEWMAEQIEREFGVKP